MFSTCFVRMRPALPLPLPVRGIIFIGLLLYNADSGGIIFRHPSVYIIEKCIMIPGFFRIHDSSASASPTHAMLVQHRR